MINNLIERAKQFKEGTKILTEWLGQGANTVDWRTAQRRADICLKCPLNQKDSVVTSAIADAIKRQLEINHVVLAGELFIKDNLVELLLKALGDFNGLAHRNVVKRPFVG